MAFAMEGDGKRIFGNSAELFRAIKEISANQVFTFGYIPKSVPVGFCIVSRAREEILLAGDTNRLVAELTFVRINDLAAPTPPVDPVLYIEPFVALLIVSNEARQCSVCFALLLRNKRFILVSASTSSCDSGIHFRPANRSVVGALDWMAVD